MLINHTQDFAAFQPALPAQIDQLMPKPALTATQSFVPGTMLETAKGWVAVEHLSAADEVYTLDGGLSRIQSVSASQPRADQQTWCIPAGVLNACSDLHVSETQLVALDSAACETLFDAPVVLAPITACAGFGGIAPTQAYRQPLNVTLEFAEEEILYAQTGALLHVPATSGDSFFRTLSYGETRAALALIDTAHHGLDPARPCAA